MYSSSYIESNKVTANSNMYSMTLNPVGSAGNAYLYGNTLSNTSQIYSNVIGVANMSYNDLKNNSTINNMTLGVNAEVSYNSLANTSYIDQINATAGNNTINNNSINNRSGITAFTPSVDEFNDDNALFNFNQITTSNVSNQFIANLP